MKTLVSRSLRFVLTALLLLSVAIVTAQEHYYDSAAGLTGITLQNQLRIIITNGHTSLGYDTAKVRLFQDIDNENGYIRCVYTGQDYNIGYNYNGSTSPNTEHSYCQSWFEGMPEQTTMRCDIHHLYATNSTVNSSRGNLPLDNVANEGSADTWPAYNGYHSYRGDNSAGREVFEPADQHKGDVARALLYMMVRYNATLTQASVNMFPTLIAWNYADPVDNREIIHNDGTYTYQHNRNPFVDHPEYVDLIWNTGTDDQTDIDSLSPILTSIYPNPFKVNTKLVFQAKTPGNITFEVYDIKGRKVNTLQYKAANKGDYYIDWNGRSDTGSSISSGVYFIKTTDGTSTSVKKVLKID